MLSKPAIVAIAFIGACTIVQTGCGSSLRKEAKEACRDDVEMYCPDVERKTRAVVECLKQHQDQISDACWNVLQRAP